MTLLSCGKRFKPRPVGVAICSHRRARLSVQVEDCPIVPSSHSPAALLSPSSRRQVDVGAFAHGHIQLVVTATSLSRHHDHGPALSHWPPQGDGMSDHDAFHPAQALTGARSPMSPAMMPDRLPAGTKTRASANASTKRSRSSEFHRYDGLPPRWWKSHLFHQAHGPTAPRVSSRPAFDDEAHEGATSERDVRARWRAGRTSHFL